MDKTTCPTVAPTPLFCPQTMSSHFRKTLKSPIFLFLFTFLLILFFSLSWVNAKEAPKPKPQLWQIDGIIAALDDRDPNVQGLALGKLAEYESQDLKGVLKKPEDIAQKAVNLLKDKSVDSNVRSKAAEALGNLGSAATPYVKDIVDILKDKSVDKYVRSIAAVALGNLGKAATPYVKDIADILKNKSVDPDVRFGAAVGLGKLGKAATPYVKDILDFLKDISVNSNAVSIAADALGNLGKAATPYVKDIVDILKDQRVDSSVRSSAVYALGNLGSAATPYVKDIVDILKDKSDDSVVRSNAALALGNLGKAATPYVKYLVDILKDQSVDYYVPFYAAVALGNLGKVATPYVKDIVDILKHKSVDLADRSNAAEALGNLGKAAPPYVKDIVDILKDQSVNSFVRSIAAEALGNFGKAATPYVKDILDFLKDKSVDFGDRSSAAEALGKIRKLEFNEVVIILDNVYNDGRSQIAQWRFLSYFVGGGTDEVKTLLKWLGSPKKTPNQLSHFEGVTTLEVFLKTWKYSKDLQLLQADLARQIATVTKKVTWKWQDFQLLESHHKHLKTAGFTETDTVHSVIDRLEFWQWFFLVKNIILVHLAIWLTLILAYPKFTQVQAMFWNPWIRRILGFGYIGIFLSWVPYLRSRLFEPFKSSLLADAGLDNFNPQAYFSETGVVETRNFASLQQDTGEIRPITEVIPSITGQIVLEGDSGLGKSMFLRHLVKTSVEITQTNPVSTKNHLFSNQIFTQKPGFWHMVRKFCSPQRIVVYLPAQKCDRGVVEAIQAKLQGQIQDAQFLKNLIYNGAIDICIDGLNEVTADTRAKISQFVENYFRGNINRVAKPPKIALALPELRCTFGGATIVPDVSVFRWERIPREPSGRIANRFESHPDWVIEILSPDQSQTKVLRNLLHCSQNGTELGWLILPEEASVLIIFPNQRIELLTGTDQLPMLSEINLSLTVEQVFSWLTI
jgi:HEAT repeat protein/Uma2 family endonuclease